MQTWSVVYGEQPSAAKWNIIGDNFTVLGDRTLYGWVTPTGSFSYNNANGITAPTDATTTFQKGDKLRFKQGGGYKYVYVTAVAATLLTVNGGTDYSVANAAITDLALSRDNNPFGFPGSFALAVSPNGQQWLTMNGPIAALRGWAYKLGDTTTAMNQALAFGITYSAVPQLVVSFPGQQVGANPTVIGDLNSQSGWVIADSSASTTSGFVQGWTRTPQGNGTTLTFGNTARFGHAFRAEGVI